MAIERRTSLTPDNADEFVQTVLRRYREDLADRAGWSDDRLQRYAKYRGWMGQKNYPWPDASNQHVPLMMSNSQRTQDTLHNAVLGSRPAISAIALNKGDAEKGKVIDELQDYQLFVEQNGEETLGDLIDSFVNDGKFVAFVPWIRDEREVVEVIPVPPIPPEEAENAWLIYRQLIVKALPQAFPTKNNKEGTSWTAKWDDEHYRPQEARIEFYLADDDRVVMQITRKQVIFEGPCVIPKSLEDIVVPARASNLQPPSPSNPNGSDHVIMVDYPSYDEIKRLQNSGYYDLLDADKLEAIEEIAEAEKGQKSPGPSDDPDVQKTQRDALAGMTYSNSETAAKSFTRLTYFGRFDLDDDGFEEEIVARVLVDQKALCRIRLLQEEYPTPTPRRPFAEATLIPVPGQFYGISLLELLEQTYDLMKVILDQMIDKHTITNVPWGFYRSASGVRPETIRMAPGELYPVSNPQQDVVFPTFPLGDQSVAMNILAYMGQWADKLSMQGNLQFGGVPQGKASALRTSANMSAVLQQGDARPERLLRRFFRGLAEIYQQMHELNQAFLPPKKQYRVSGVPPAGADPYKQVESASSISGRFQFDFKANALNTSKAAQSQILQQMMGALANGMTLQMGLTDKEHIYNLLHDWVVSLGQNDTRYLIAPPESNIPKITAEEALGQIAQGQMPQGKPAEGIQDHLATIQNFMHDPRMSQLAQADPAFSLILHAYLQQVQGLLQQQQVQAQQAQMFAQAQGGGGGGQPGPQGQQDPGAQEMGMQGPGQVNDESLPGAKGMM